MNNVDGSIAICTTERMASIEAMRGYMHRNLRMPMHIICVLAKMKISPEGIDCNVCQQTQLASKSAIQLLSDDGLSGTLFEACKFFSISFDYFYCIYCVE